MNQDRTSQPKQTFNLLNITTITTIIITPGADIGLWWSCRAIGIITTTIITITAITEIAYPRWKMKTGPSGSCFFTPAAQGLRRFLRAKRRERD